MEMTNYLIQEIEDGPLFLYWDITILRIDLKTNGINIIDNEYPKIYQKCSFGLGRTGYKLIDKKGVII